MNDAIAGAIWFAVNAAAVLAAWRVARRALRDDSAPQSAMHTLVIFWSAIVAVCLLLGGFGVLTAGAMGALMLALAASVHLYFAGPRRWVAACRRREATSWGSAAKSSDVVAETQNATEGAARGDLVPHSETGPFDVEEAKAAPPREKAAMNRRTPRKWFHLLWGALAALAGGMVVQRLLGFPEHWDDLMYHLPFVDHWLQDRSIYRPATSEWTNACNAEFIGLWLVAPFSGDFWIGTANSPVVALLALAVVELGRELGLAPLTRHAVAIAALATNVILIQLIDLENDTAAAALFIAGLAYASRYARTGSAADLILCACALGILPGVKYYALGYAAVAAVVVVGLAWACRGRQEALRLAAVGIAAGILLSGYWYARNWYVTGTPVFPLGISSKTDVLRSLNPETYAHTLLGSRRASLWAQYFQALWKLGGPCHIVAAALIPSATIWLVASPWQRRAVAGKPLRVAVGSALFLSFCVFAVTPYTVSDDDPRKLNGDYTAMRYSQCFTLLSLLAAGTILSDMGEPLARLLFRGSRYRFAGVPLGATLALAAVYQLFARGREMLQPDVYCYAVGLALLGLLCMAISNKVIAGPRHLAAAGAATAVAIAALSAILAERWHSKFAPRFDLQFRTGAFTRLRAQARDVNIGVIDYRYYPFFGSRRQFRAYRPFRIDSRSALYEYLRANKIDLLAVVRNDYFKHGRYRGAGDWVRQDAAQFKKIDAAAGFDIYRVNLTEQNGSSPVENGGAASARPRTTAMRHAERRAQE